MATNNDERLASLLAKRAALEARIQRLKERGAATERKARSRALLLLGVMLEKQLQKAPAESTVIREMIREHLLPREQAVVNQYLQAAIK